MELNEKKYPMPYCVIDNQICTAEKYFGYSNYKWAYEKSERRKNDDRRKK